jgi:Fur family transcriptional regulator, ferric uptake regulator
MENFLRSKKLRATPFRVAVLEVFSRHKNAIDIEQIETSLKEFDRITLYRTVRTFIEKGLIHEIVMPGEVKKLALCKDECKGADHAHHHQHLHFKCDNCDEVYCLELNQFPEINYPEFKVTRLEIQGSGICRACS